MVKLWAILGLILLPLHASASFTDEAECAGVGASAYAIIDGKCVLQVNQTLSWDGAASWCLGLDEDGYALTIDSVDFLTAVQGNFSISDDSWIGVYTTGASGEFTEWHDGTTYSYNNFDTGFPVGGEPEYGLMRSDGMWETVEADVNPTRDWHFCQVAMAPPIEGEGELVLLHSACNTFELDGSGGVLACSQWDTSIEIPAIAAVNSQIAYVLFAVVLYILKLCMYAIILYVLARWLFRIVTGARSNHYRRRYVRRS